MNQCLNETSTDAESFQEQFDRVCLMSQGGETWDLSDNDCAALESVLKSHAELKARLAICLEALEWAVEAVEYWADDQPESDDAIAAKRAVKDALKTAIHKDAE